MKTKISAALAAIALLGIGIAWATGQFSEDPQLREVKQLQQELQESVAKEFEGEQKPDETSREDRREKFQELREKTEALPEEQQSVVQTEMMKFFMARMENRLDEFFELPPEERTAELDRQIDQMEERRKSWEERRKKREEERAAAEASGQNTADGDAAGAGGKAAGGSATAGKQPGTNSGYAGKGRGGPGSGRGPGRGRPSDEQREQWRRTMLDNTTPESRAKFTEFRRLMQERRDERGLPSFRGRPF